MGRTEARRESWMAALSLQRKRLSRTIRVQRLTRRAREDDVSGARANSINYDSVYSTTAGEGADVFEAFEMDSPFASPCPDRQERQNDSKSRTRRRVGGTRRDKKVAARLPKERQSGASSEPGRSGSGKQSTAEHSRSNKGRQTQVESDADEDDLPRGSALASFLEDNRYNSLRAKALREVEEMENGIERARRGHKGGAAEGLEVHLKNVLVFKPRKTNFTRRERGRKLGSKAARYVPSPASPPSSSSSSSSSSTSATSSRPPFRATGRKTHKLRATTAKAKASVNCPSHDPIADML
mmetsp:Transcript_11016/g.35097  ORF Transcript_11016/g.35097 Transcript_11016/m.35097 type:complete len:297 (-) Transcript_11016:76-966(-)